MLETKTYTPFHRCQKPFILHRKVDWGKCKEGKNATKNNKEWVPIPQPFCEVFNRGYYLLTTTWMRYSYEPNKKSKEKYHK